MTVPEALQHYKGTTMFSNKFPSGNSNTRIITDRNWRSGSTNLK